MLRFPCFLTHPLFILMCVTARPIYEVHFRNRLFFSMLPLLLCPYIWTLLWGEYLKLTRDMMNSISPKHSFVSLCLVLTLFLQCSHKIYAFSVHVFWIFCGFVFAVLQHFTSLLFQDTITAQWIMVVVLTSAWLPQEAVLAAALTTQLEWIV